MYEHYEFIWEFFIVNKEENTLNIRFTGKITYNLENGLVLEYNLPDCFNKQEDLKPIEYLHGILLDGTRCTLIGPFNFNNTFGGHSGDENHVSTRFGKYRFNILLLGVFYENTINFESCDFTFNQLQSYMLPQSGMAEYSYEPLADVDIESGNIKILHRAKVLWGDITNLIVSNNKEATEKIKYEVKSVFDKYKDVIVNRMEDLECYLKYTPKDISVISLQEYIKNIVDISQFFSVLTDKPIIMDKVEFRVSSKIENVGMINIKIPILISMNMSDEAAKIAQQEINIMEFPIWPRSMNFSKNLPKWIEEKDNYQVILNIIQYQKERITQAEAYASIILLSTYLEGISSELGKHKGGKYKAPIDEYASPKLKTYLLQVLKTTDDKLATDLSDLRNELGHIKKDKRLMKKLTLSEYAEIVKIYETIIISDLLKKLGLDMSTIHHYQLIKLHLP